MTACRVCGKTIRAASAPLRPWCSLKCYRRLHTCPACKARLREPSLTGHCGFCQVELWGWSEPACPSLYDKGDE